jgi:hypothetical protein
LEDIMFRSAPLRHHRVQHTLLSFLALIAVLFFLLPTVVEASKPIGTGGVEWSFDRPGQDYQNFVLRWADPTACRDACLADSRCKAWTYVHPNTIQGPQPRCWLKHGIPQATANNCCVSGVKAIQQPVIPPAGMSQAECEARFCPECRNSINLLGASVDPGCERCLRAHTNNIRACINGGDGSSPANPGNSGPPQGRECYVASTYDQPPRYAVACDGNDGPATWKLGTAGYFHVEFGPTSWDSCQQFMRSRKQRGW